MEYTTSLLSLVGELHRRGMSFGFVTKIGTAIGNQRNWIASLFWADERFTHLLFIDDDMSFRPSAALKLIASGYDVCGCMYPMKRSDMEHYHQIRVSGVQAGKARNVSQSYVVLGDIGKECVDGGWVIARRGSFVPVTRIGCGITLISRGAIRQMLERCPKVHTPPSVRYYDDIKDRKDIIRLFDPIIDVDGASVSEDLSFCHRWVKYCEGLIWACVDEDIGHVGRYVYNGVAADRIEHGMTSGDDL